MTTGCTTGVEIVFAKEKIFTHPLIPSMEGRIAKTIATKA